MVHPGNCPRGYARDKLEKFVKWSGNKIADSPPVFDAKCIAKMPSARGVVLRTAK